MDYRGLECGAVPALLRDRRPGGPPGHAPGDYRGSVTSRDRGRGRRPASGASRVPDGGKELFPDTVPPSSIGHTAFTRRGVDEASTASIPRVPSVHVLRSVNNGG